mgnify:FL=1
MTAVLAVTHEPIDLVFGLAVVAAMTLWIWVDHRPRCGCPGPCAKCPPLTDDRQADAEYRTTRHMFTAPGRNPGRR